MVVSYGAFDGLRAREKIMMTETLDKIYLEWSQFTSARTAREIAMLNALNAAIDWYTPPNDDGPFPLKKIADAVALAATSTPERARADHADLVKS